MLEISFSPFPERKTERLLLRSISMFDAGTLFQIRTMPELFSYFGREPFKTIQESEEHIALLLKNIEKNEGVIWAIAFKESPETLIGTIGYWRLLKEHFRAEIGYMLHPGYWNRGIMKEALKEVINYAFNDTAIHSIEANIDPENIASGRLLESCGFIVEGYFKENYYSKGEFKDSKIYSLIKGYPTAGIANV